MHRDFIINGCPKTFKNLKEKGYSINEQKANITGKVDAILILPDGTLEGGADYRGDDKAIGY
jgi:gamma-glutamyltranspeptidase/glutathione hydrolase